tara:strand:+ start:10632 stop:10847 length:216 start_codon:yes stop_codon:yes gene_type:complete
METFLINKIENGLRGLRLGTKTPTTVDINRFLLRLKDRNYGMYEELQKQYVDQVTKIKKKETDKLFGKSSY